MSPCCHTRCAHLLQSPAALSASVRQEEGTAASALSNASVCLHFFYPDAGDIDRSVNVNVLAVVCCFSCLLIKIMQNEGKAIFFFFRLKNEIQSTVIEYSLLECDGAVCHPPDVRIPTITGGNALF